MFSQNGRRQADKERKKNLSPDLRSYPAWGRKFPKEIAKKIEKIKKPLSSIIFSQNRMRQAEKERKKNFVPNSVHTRPGQENSEENSKKIQKIKKSLSGIIFSQNGRRQADKERKIILVPNSVHAWSEEENSEKKQHKNSKNSKTTFQHYFYPKRDEIGREKEKKIQCRILFILSPGKKIP